MPLDGSQSNCNSFFSKCQMIIQLLNQFVLMMMALIVCPMLLPLGHSDFSFLFCFCSSRSTGNGRVAEPLVMFFGSPHFRCAQSEIKLNSSSIVVWRNRTASSPFRLKALSSCCSSFSRRAPITNALSRPNGWSSYIFPFFFAAPPQTSETSASASDAKECFIVVASSSLGGLDHHHAAKFSARATWARRRISVLLWFRRKEALAAAAVQLHLLNCCSLLFPP